MAWAFVLADYAFSFTSYNFGVSPGARNVMLGFLALFITGYWFGDVVLDPEPAGIRGREPKPQAPPVASRIDMARFVRWLAIIGLVGALMMTVDYLFLRHLDYSAGVAGARSQLQLGIRAGGSSQPALFRPGVGSNPWSITSRVLGEFATVAVALLLLRGERLRDRVTVGLCLSALVVHFFALTLTGGRNSIAVALIVLFGAVLVRRGLGKRTLPPIKTVRLGLAAMVPAAGVYFIYIFRARQALRGTTAFGALLTLQSSFLLKVKPEAWAILDGSSLLSTMLVPLIQLQTYIAHSFQEFSLLIAQRPRPGPFFGLYDLYVPGLFVSKFHVISPDHMHNVIFSSNRTGVYESLLGSLYRDFGVTGCLVAGFLFGALAGVVWRRLHRGGGLQWELGATYVVAAIIASPVVSILNTGTGFELLTALLVTVVLARRVSDRMPATTPVARPGALATVSGMRS